MNENKLSVLMSVFNGEKYLSEAIESVLAQSYREFEFIIVDDAATDSTSVMLSRYAAQDSRIKLVQNNANLGLTKSLNLGLAMARGKYIARMDADDVSLPDRFKKQVQFLDQHPEAVLITGWIQNIDDQGNHLHLLKKEVQPELASWFLMFYNYIGSHSQATFCRAAVEKVGGYNETLRYSQDYELWTRICSLGELHILPEVMLLYRCHTDNISVVFHDEQTRNSLQISKAMIGSIMDDPPELDEIACMRRFWQWDFAPEDDPAMLQAELERIFNAFALRHPNPRSKRNLQRIKYLAGQQFLRLASMYYGAGQMLSAIRAIYYATCWLRGKVIKRCFSRLLLSKMEKSSGAEENNPHA